MFDKTFSSMLILITSFWLGGPVIASPLDARDDVVYSPQDTYGGGWVNVSPATKGNYVHRSGATHDSDRTGEAYMVGKAPRQDFDYLTAEEQEGLWNYRQKMREDMREAMRVAALASTPNKAMRAQSLWAKLQWPRVIVEGNAVCVPKVEFSEVADWGDHLVCTNVELQHE